MVTGVQMALNNRLRMLGLYAEVQPSIPHILYRAD